MATKDQVLTRKKVKLQKPPVYCIVFYNNDKTSIQTIISLLLTVFKYSLEEAEKITLTIHNSKHAPVFINSKEVCQLKYELVKRVCNHIGEEHLQFEIKLYEGDDNGNN